MQLLAPITFIDSGGKRWEVPKGATVDGASIPRFFWTFIGGPFEGLYRDASVIHDWYCDVRTRPWREVDRMFYEAMIARGVAQAQAKVMYLAVVFGGPRWDDQAVANNLLTPELRPARRKLQPGNLAMSVTSADPFDSLEVVSPAPSADKRFEAMAAQVKAGDLSLDAIDKLAEADPKNIAVFGSPKAPLQANMPPPPDPNHVIG